MGLVGDDLDGLRLDPEIAGIGLGLVRVDGLERALQAAMDEEDLGAVGMALLGPVLLEPGHRVAGPGVAGLVVPRPAVDGPVRSEVPPVVTPAVEDAARVEAVAPLERAEVVGIASAVVDRARVVIGPKTMRAGAPVSAGRARRMAAPDVVAVPGVGGVGRDVAQSLLAPSLVGPGLRMTVMERVAGVADPVAEFGAIVGGPGMQSMVAGETVAGSVVRPLTVSGSDDRLAARRASVPDALRPRAGLPVASLHADLRGWAADAGARGEATRADGADVGKGGVDDSEGAPPRLGVAGFQTPAMPPREGARAEQSGAVLLDGQLVGRWLVGRMGREASRPAVGMTGFDPRQSAGWQGGV